MENEHFAAQVTEISRLLEERLRVRGRTLDRQLRKAGRTLPRAVRREAEYIAHAAGLAQNPKLMRMIDGAKADHAHAAVVGWLKTVDPKARARGRWLNLAAVIGFNLLLLGGLLVWFLVWRGIV